MRIYNGRRSTPASQAQDVVYCNKAFGKSKPKSHSRALKQSERNEVREDIKDEVETMDISDRDLGITNVHGTPVDTDWIAESN